MPTVLVARNRLLQQISASRMYREKVIKIIHGYGSTGKGGAIKREVVSILNEQLNKGAIKGYVKGEDFPPFGEAARKLLALYPDVARDRDFSRGNDGITIVWF